MGKKSYFTASWKGTNKTKYQKKNKQAIKGKQPPAIPQISRLPKDSDNNQMDAAPTFTDAEPSTGIFDYTQEQEQTQFFEATSLATVWGPIVTPLLCTQPAQSLALNSQETGINVLAVDNAEQPSKKQKLDEPFALLSERLSGLVSCVVCLKLPDSFVYQCRRGHLMCADCLYRLFADGRLRDQLATCPRCHVTISEHTVVRNFPIEKVLSELPGGYRQCNLGQHPTHRMYSNIGCQRLGVRIEDIFREYRCLGETGSFSGDEIEDDEIEDDEIEHEITEYDTLSVYIELRTS
uniref:RING-type domain-containing protein n=1 Tax=Glossina pallidipes TaxID=7398 RepID=A0A1A9ZQM1_GLOPL